jgi:ParB family chromosome partitioning protein
MAEFKIVPISEIVVPERLRQVEEEHAIAIAQSIIEHGLLNPITVRLTPAAKGGNYTLVAGAHRLRAVELNQERQIEAMIVVADKADGQLLEITENLFRNELSVIDRATFVATYRDIWEQKYGKITRGGDRKSKGKDYPLIHNRANILDLVGEEATSGFARHVADRMGVSKEALKLIDRIARNLHPDVRAAVRGTPVADNQAALLKLAKLEPAKQRQAAIALRRNPDVKAALAVIDDRTKPVKPTVADEQRQLLARLSDAWGRANAETKREFLGLIGAEIAGNLEAAA